MGKPAKSRTVTPPVPKQPAEKQPRKWLSIRWDFAAAAVAIVLIAWLVTEGDWNFFPPAGFLEGFYDAQAKSLLQGRIDVPPDSIVPEAFMRNGKAYGYFGPTPALARMPLDLLVPALDGRWSRISMLLASVLVACMLLLLLRRLEELLPGTHGGRLWRALGAILILAAAIGSTNFVVSAEAKIYQESIAWGSALALAYAVCLLSWIMRPGRKWLALSCLTAFFAFFARVSSGAGPMFALFVLDLALAIPAPRLRSYWAVASLPARRDAIIAFTATIAVTAVLWGALNYWKFGLVFVSQPMALNSQYDAERVHRIKGSLFSLANLPVTVWSYFSPGNIAFGKSFPWVNFVRPDRLAVAARFPGAHLDSVEPFASMPAGMPELLLAALAGTAVCFTRRGKRLAALRAPMIGTIAGSGLIFTWGLITYRYLHDVFPWLALGSAIAIARIPSIGSQRARRTLAALFAIGAAYSICANGWFGILQQRAYAMPVRPEKRLALVDLGQEIEQQGWRGLVFHASHWRGYIPAGSMQAGNLVADLAFAERRDHPVAHSSGPPPYAVEYGIDIPAAGTYNLAFRYASPNSRPLRLFLDGREYAAVCAAPTGGSAGRYQAWVPAGLVRLPEGRLRVQLASFHEFPYLSMIRFVRMD